MAIMDFLKKSAEKKKELSAKKTENFEQNQSIKIADKKQGTNNFSPSLKKSGIFLIEKAWISEKATNLIKQNKYVFIINPKANKSEIKKAAQNIYNVKVEKINIIKDKDKTKKLGKSIGVKPGNKKAIITLKEGQNIDLMPH